MTRASWWQRRVVAPIVQQLRQGITPQKIALTLALGGVLGIFPILGATTLLCGIAGVWLRLNQPIIQLVNYLVYPLQIALLIPFYRAGFPIFDRLGPGHQLLVGYRGSREVVFDIANLLIEDHEKNRQPNPETWRHGFDSLKSDGRPISH